MAPDIVPVIGNLMIQENRHQLHVKDKLFFILRL